MPSEELTPDQLFIMALDEAEERGKHLQEKPEQLSLFDE